MRGTIVSTRDTRVAIGCDTPLERRDVARRVVVHPHQKLGYGDGTAARDVRDADTDVIRSSAEPQLVCETVSNLHCAVLMMFVDVQQHSRQWQEQQQRRLRRRRRRDQ